MFHLIVSFFLRSSSHKCYPCIECCVSFRTKNALKSLELCKNTEKRPFHHVDHLKFDRFHYKKLSTNCSVL